MAGADLVPTYSRLQGAWWLAAMEVRPLGGDQWSPNRGLKQPWPDRRRAETTLRLCFAVGFAVAFPWVAVRVSVHVDDCALLWRDLLLFLLFAPTLEVILVPQGPAQDWMAAARLAKEARQRSGYARFMLGTDLYEGAMPDFKRLPEEIDGSLLGYRISGALVDSFYNEESRTPEGAARASVALARALARARSLRPELKVVVEAPNPFGAGARALVAPFSPAGLEERGCLALATLGSLEVVGDTGPSSKARV
jgi:hypothetical protein